MQPLIERGLTMHWRWRLVSVLCALVLLYSALSVLATRLFSFSNAPEQMRSALRLQTQQQFSQIRQMAVAGATPAALVPPQPAQTFSALALSRESRGTLVSWQPGKPQSELILELDWRQLPTLFALLGRQNIEPEGFILSMDKQVLTLALRLGEVG